MMTSSPSAFHPAVEQLDGVLAFLPLLDPTSDDPTIHTGRFMQAVYDNGLVVDFDWMQWQEVAEQFTHPAVMDQAALPDLVRLLTLHVRKERFCWGHLESAIRRGHMHQLLLRLQQIRHRELS
jgi:hypothetical protein